MPMDPGAAVPCPSEGIRKILPKIICIFGMMVMVNVKVRRGSYVPKLVVPHTCIRTLGQTQARCNLTMAAGSARTKSKKMIGHAHTPCIGPRAGFSVLLGTFFATAVSMDLGRSLRVVVVTISLGA